MQTRSPRSRASEPAQPKPAQPQQPGWGKSAVESTPPIAHDFSHVDLFSHAPPRAPIQMKLGVETANDAATHQESLSENAFQMRSEVQRQEPEKHESHMKRAIQGQDSTKDTLQMRPLAASIQPASSRIQKLTAIPPNSQPINYWAPSGWPNGEVHQVPTAGGTLVNVWRPGPAAAGNSLLYWCHGHSLDTFRNFGYSVFSGASYMLQVMKDEHQMIAGVNMRGAQANDIVLWNDAQNPAIHSARLLSVALNDNGEIKPDETYLSSKDGQAAVQATTLTDLIKTYGKVYTVWR
jgi:hypothetical protein